MTTKGVTESVAGTMPKPEGQKPPDGDGKAPASVSTVSPETKKSYSEEEVQAILHVANSESGRQRKSVETERDTYKRQLEVKDQEIADNTAEVTKLQEKLDAMSSDDPNKYDVVKELKAVREERRQLRSDRQGLETEKLTHADRLKRAEEFEKEALIQELIEEYQGGDFDKLKSLVDVFGASSEEQIRRAADTLWVKKTTLQPPPLPPVRPYSGQTDGGKSQSDSEIIRNYADNPHDKQAKQDWLDLQARRKRRP